MIAYRPEYARRGPVVLSDPAGRRTAIRSSTVCLHEIGALITFCRYHGDG